MADKGLFLMGAVLGCAVLPASARAYSDPSLYPEPVDIGGGGGRWFTGSSADGFACDVCHTGGTGPNITVGGLPDEGITPGAHYDIFLSWPANAQLSLTAEFTDELRRGAGTIALPNPQSTQPFERCALEEGGELPTGLFEAENGRNVFTVIDCGAQSTRFRWTAPAAIAGPLWFNVGFVASNEDARPTGDGVTIVRRALHAAGAAMTRRVITQGCNANGASAHSMGGWWLLGLGLVSFYRVRRARRNEEVGHG